MQEQPKSEGAKPTTIKLTEEMLFSSCHQELDDENAGVVAKGGTGSLELTFHSDHIFGDQDTLTEEGSVNEIALGFEAISKLADEDDVVDVTQDEMHDGLEETEYQVFIAALRTIGHSGEGHCGYSVPEEE